jgi:uncharacterized repeat protein (TIGR01451 family)
LLAERIEPHMPRTTTSLVLLCALVLISFHRVLAQPVLIPDVQLRAALNEWVPGAVDASGFMDPNDPDILAQEYLELHVRWSPADLTGLEALAALDHLQVISECDALGDGTWEVCSTNIINVPQWPQALLSISLMRGTLPSLPPWPTTLTDIWIDLSEGFGEVPPLPDGLNRFVHLTSTSITAHPLLPAGMTMLTLTTEPGVAFPLLPQGLVQLELEGDAGVALPAIPTGLYELTLSFFEDTIVLTEWPEGLTWLALSYWPNITSLPSAWPVGLELLGLGGIPLDQLNMPFPPGLTQLYLFDSPFTAIPTLPDGLQWLQLTSLTELNCVPKLPEGIEMVRIDSPVLAPSAFNCIANRPPSASIYWNDVEATFDDSRICTLFNGVCPGVNPTATGRVFIDSNANGAYDEGEPGYPSAMIHVQPLNVTFGTSDTGQFTLPMPAGDHVVSVSTNDPWVQSIAPASRDVELWDPLEPSVGHDFAVTLLPEIQDLAITLAIPFARPGIVSTGTITYRNAGNIPMDGTIDLSLAAPFLFMSSSVPPASSSLNLASWEFTDLQPGQVRYIFFRFIPTIGLPAGMVVSSMVRIEPLPGDAAPSNNIDLCATTISNSYDPNDKLVEPSSLTPAQVAAGEELMYTIRFQNTGNAPAYRVVITDTLSTDLQWSTMRFIDSSHPCSWLLTGEGVLRFEFDPILLPDSISDEPNSHGFIRFSMLPSSNLQLGDEVANVANIYFDFNDPVITEPVVFTVEETTSLTERDRPAIRLIPNPASEQATLVFPDVLITGAEIQVCDAMGRVMLRERVAAGSHTALLDLNALQAGLYTCRLSGPASDPIGTRLVVVH